MKILICSLNTLGFVNPMIGLAKKLEEMGHEVAFVCNEPLSTLLQSQNLKRIPLGNQDGSSFIVQKFSEPSLNLIQVEHIEYALKQFPANLLVANPLVFGAMIMAERHAIPLATMGFLSYLWNTTKKDFSLSQEMVDLYDWRTKDMLEHYNNTRKFLGLSELTLNNDNLPFIGDLFLQRSSPTLAPRLDLYPDKVKLVGSCLWEADVNGSEQEKLDSFLNQQNSFGRKVIYVNHGRTFHLPRFWEYLISAFANSKYLIVASVGRMDGGIGKVPENFFVKPYIPQSKILPHASLVIANGNTTVTLGSLEHGVPLLIIPGGGETVDNAELCSEANVARCIPCDEVNVDRLNIEVEQLLNENSYLDHCSEVQEDLIQYKGFSHAANLITEFMH